MDLESVTEVEGVSEGSASAEVSSVSEERTQLDSPPPNAESRPARDPAKSTLKNSGMVQPIPTHPHARSHARAHTVSLMRGWSPSQFALSADDLAKAQLKKKKPVDDHQKSKTLTQVLFGDLFLRVSTYSDRHVRA